MPAKVFVVVGSGPGIGVATASIFASHGFTVALLSRNGDRLKEDASKVQAAASDSNARVHTFAVDVGDHAALEQTLQQVEKEVGGPEVVLFNAARVAESTIGKEDPEKIISDFKIMNIGLITTATWAIPHLTSLANNPSTHPSFFMTGGGIWLHPSSQHFALSLQKAGQVNFAGSLDQVIGLKGVHVATVSVNGPVSDDDPVLNAKNVARTYWKLYSESRGKEKDEWEKMVHVGKFE